MSYLRGEEPRPEGCIFCNRPLSEDAEVHILYRGPSCYVILNRFPYNDGHLMVVPFQHVPTLEDLDAETAIELMELVQKSIRILRVAYEPDGFNVGINIGSAAGAGIAGHVHCHVVPRWSGDTNFLTVVGGTRTIPEWLDQTYERLRPLFEQVAG